MSIRSLLIISSLFAMGVFFIVGKDAMKSLSTPDVMTVDGESVSQASYSSDSESFFGFASKSQTQDPFDSPASARVDASGITLMKFGAPWCGPCKMLDAELDKLQNKYPGLTITRIDVDNQSRKAEKFGVSSIPHSFLMKNGKRIGDRVGYQSEKKLERWITEHAESKPIKMQSNPFVK